MLHFHYLVMIQSAVLWNSIMSTCVQYRCKILWWTDHCVIVANGEWGFYSVMRCNLTGFSSCTLHVIKSKFLISRVKYIGLNYYFVFTNYHRKIIIFIKMSGIFINTHARLPSEGKWNSVLGELINFEVTRLDWQVTSKSWFDQNLNEYTGCIAVAWTKLT